MPNRTVPAAAKGLPEKDDKVLILATRLADTLKAEAAFERKSMESRHARNFAASTYFESAFAHSGDADEAIREAIAFEKAKTAAGTAVQITMALSRVEAIKDYYSAEEEMPYHLQKEFRLVNRLLFSALDMLAAKPDVAKLIAAIGSPWLNPWNAAQEAEERLKAREHVEAA